MNRKILLSLGLLISLVVQGQTYKFDFTNNKKVKEGYTAVTSSDIYSEERGYGYDHQSTPDGGTAKPFFFSVTLPDGNWHVIVVIGSKKQAGETTVRGESRRLFFENISTKKGETKVCSFVINKREPIISDKEVVKIKEREKAKLNWDKKLTLEFNGEKPLINELIIEPATDVTTVFLCGNSTVVDQDNEPWASWGQMIPRFFTDKIAIANYAESGESANTFIAAGRLKKALSQMKAGDYLLVEFGHNDQKQKGPGKGAYYSYMTSLKTFIDEARLRGAHPILITPTQRRNFGADGKIKDTHEDYPEAMRWLANKENVPLIDLNELTRTLYEAMGVDDSKKAFVHYPAGTYPNQDKDLADNTHFNTYGAYQIAKCILEGLKQINNPLVEYIRTDY
ncbi:MAG: rhamnogalacturonan acetylesterase, partial [Phocaeicola sp.]